MVAAAGYGKTVLAAQAVEYLKVKTVWYQLDEYDNDFSVFISYLNKGIGKHWPSIESTLMPLLQNNPVSQREIRVLLSALLLEIENYIDEDVLIVLDDFHFILKIEVLHKVADGDTNTEISQSLNISPHTVKSHVIHIFNKIGVDDRTQAAVWAVRHNLF